MTPQLFKTLILYENVENYCHLMLCARVGVRLDLQSPGNNDVLLKM